MPSKTSLVICDLQTDLLGSLHEREALLSSLKVIHEIAQKRGWLIVYSGLKFKSSYEGVSESHKLYGALKKLNNKLGDKAVHWFMEGFTGSDFYTLDKDEGDADDTLFRQILRSKHSHDELVNLLTEEGIDTAYIVGAKASGSVQLAMQSIMDEGIVCTAIAECIKDDNEEKCQAILRHLLPVYGNVVKMQEIVEDFGIDQLTPQTKNMYIGLISNHHENDFLLATDCNRRGHGARYIELLMQRGNWKMYPSQIWYEDFIKGEFYCPVGKRVVDFCDEPDFSNISMYLVGRDHLDEKDKVIEIAGKYMPKTYCIENGQWIGDAPPSDEEEGATASPWFIKESDKNLGGAAIMIVARPSEIMANITPNEKKRYVVQQHIRDPLLTDDGRKTHLKFYVLLIGEEDGKQWELFTYKGALLSISPQKWTANDLSQDTQVTIHRHPEHPSETEGWKQHWDDVYKRCKNATAEVIENAIKSRKLRGRNKKQFEVFSVDWMPDTNGNLWMFEFNFSPAVAQPEFNDPNSRDKRRDYLMKHDEAMLREALDIVVPWEQSSEVDGEWDFVKKIYS